MLALHPTNYVELRTYDLVFNCLIASDSVVVAVTFVLLSVEVLYGFIVEEAVGVNPACYL